INPAVAKSSDGVWCERLTGAMEEFGIVHRDEQVVPHLETDLTVAKLLGDEMVAVEADGHAKGRVAADADGIAHAEMAILDEEVVVIDAAPAAGDLARSVLSLLGDVGSEGGNFFLNLDDAVNGFFAVTHALQEVGS